MVNTKTTAVSSTDWVVYTCNRIVFQPITPPQINADLYHSKNNTPRELIQGLQDRQYKTRHAITLFAETMFLPIVGMNDLLCHFCYRAYRYRRQAAWWILASSCPWGTSSTASPFRSVSLLPFDFDLRLWLLTLRWLYIWLLTVNFYLDFDVGLRPLAVDFGFWLWLRFMALTLNSHSLLNIVIYSYR